MAAAVSMTAAQAFAAISENTLRRLSPKGKAAMEASLELTLENDGQEENAWRDQESNLRGQFKIGERYYHRETRRYCVQYVHVIRRTQESEAKMSCYTQGKWQPFQGDAALLIKAERSFKNAGEYEAAAQIPKAGPLGPEYRDRAEFTHMLWPQVLGALVDQFNYYQFFLNKLSGASRGPTEEAMLKYMQSNMIERMTKPENKLGIGMHQIAIILKVFRAEKAEDAEATRLKVLEMLSKASVIKPIGDAKLVTNLFEKQANKARAQALIANQGN